MKKNLLWMATILVCCVSFFTSCSDDDDPVNPTPDEVEVQLQKMTLREKVGQMFYVACPDVSAEDVLCAPRVSGHNHPLQHAGWH